MDIFLKSQQGLFQKAKFGTAGNPDRFLEEGNKSSKDMPRFLREKGLDAYEYQCGKGVTIGEKTAREIGAEAADSGIAMSLHAPYFVNPANPSPESVEKTVRHVLAACRVAEWMGAFRVVVHTGALMKQPRREALETAKKAFCELRRRCDDEGFEKITLCPETMGKHNQLGDLEEVLEICSQEERLIPCIDFGHLYARSLGKLEGRKAVAQMMERIEEVLGTQRAKSSHVHFSQIEFSEKGGEVRHLTFHQESFGPDPVPLCQEIALRGWSPVVICESAGTQDLDALAMKNYYEKSLLLRFIGVNFR